MDSVVTLFSAYWWLLFPFGFLLLAGWNSLMETKRAQARFELLKAYAKSGQEPPRSLLAEIRAMEQGEDETPAPQNGATGFLVTLFTGLAGVFAILGYTGALGAYDAEFYVAAACLGVLALAYFVSGIATGGRRRNA